VAIWLILALAGALAVLVATRAVEWHRFSKGHFTVQFAIRDRGLYFGRTPDDTWWKIRLGQRDCTYVYPSDWGDPPPDSGVREPRGPLPAGPGASGVEP
jgi:hypothetical protein